MISSWQQTLIYNYSLTPPIQVMLIRVNDHEKNLNSFSAYSLARVIKHLVNTLS